MPNDTKEEKKQGKASGVSVALLMLLIILILISGILLSVRLVAYIAIDDREVFLESNLDAQFELFSIEYENASGEVTVRGTDGEKVIAPGTSMEYIIKLRNTDKTAIDYDMIPDVRFSSEYEIPILVRMIDGDGAYLVGDEDTWVGIAELNYLSEQATLKRGESAEYHFQWKWEFESGDDAYDTALGTASLTTDIGVAVEFSVHAEANTTLATNGGFTDSGICYPALLFLLLLMLLIAIILLIVSMVKKRKSETYEKDS